MALYAFDGTWNTIHDGEEVTKNTNVKRLCGMYTLPGSVGPFYLAGVGTKLGWLGKIFGGAFGFGADARVDAMYGHVCHTFAAGHTDIEVIGFSRGAALALDLVNRLYRNGIVDPRTGKKIAHEPAVMFLGLWDTVGSFGITFGPFQKINLGHHLGVPTNVRNCFHALALDERRSKFKPTRLDAQRAYEVWFRGVHSDIGGGNGNTKLGNIALRWMARKALLSGVPIDAAGMPADGDIDADAAICEPLDIVEIGHRKLRDDDRIHYTVKARTDGRCFDPPDGCIRESVQDEATAGARP